MRNHELIKKIISQAAKYIPHQGPLQFFVHHNTLQAFEHLHFKQAVKEASELYGAKCFLSEEQFAKAIINNRIQDIDISEVIKSEGNNLQEIIIKNISRFDFRNKRLHNLFQIPSSKTVSWNIKNQIKNKQDRQLFYLLQVPDSVMIARNNRLIRTRDKILNKYNIDIDELVNPFLIKLASGFLDQGLASITMPKRSLGFLKSFCNLYKNSKIIGEVWTKNLTNECLNYSNQNSFEIIISILGAVQINQEDWQEYINRTLLSIGGWAGMFYQYQQHPEKNLVQEIPAKLEDFLAVKLILDMVAARFILEKKKSDFRGINQFKNIKSSHKEREILQYEAFMSAKIFALESKDFINDKVITNWYNEIITFNQFERQYYLHLAFERRYRQNTLDALIFAQKFKSGTKKSKPRFQAVFCMDDREESLRRHLEELSDQKFETFGFAGFFGVAMQYKGLDDIKPRPLCPVNINPQILVEELALDNLSSAFYSRKKKKRGLIFNFIRKTRDSIFTGLIWSFTFGLIKTIPLIGHSLFPRYTSQIKERIEKFKISRPKTRLNIECQNKEEKKYGFRVGFSIDEMTNIVFSILNSMGTTKNLSSLFFIVGHGSSSLNNPHKAAYDCGATGGGKGGPNARALAQMANHSEIKKQLKIKGFNIDNTYFIGACHNTCDDSMEYYDLDLMPKELVDQFNKAQLLLQKACNFDAHERCRRFESVPNWVSPKLAALYVKQRANDLAQPRPECGHATNAVCIIGGRQKTNNIFLDRRSFLISYDYDNDQEGKILANILQAAAPVGAGINLEYYFSYIDQVNYGSGTKLPHNITGLIGVMNGFSSDLRTGLPWQMVEIHEPVRLLIIVQSSEEVLLKIAKEREEVGRLVKNEWVQLISWHPKKGTFSRFHNGQFIAHNIETHQFSLANSSRDHYQSYLGNLDYVYIQN